MKPLTLAPLIPVACPIPSVPYVPSGRSCRLIWQDRLWPCGFTEPQI